MLMRSLLSKKYREDFPNVIPPIASSFVACCTLVEVGFNSKKLVFFSNWLVAFIGNGCSVNKLAG